MATSDPQAHGTWRGPELRAALVRAGLADVWLRTTLIERFAPLQPVEERVIAAAIRAFAAIAATRDLPEADHAEWARLREDAAAEVRHPEFYFREANVLAVGRVPGP